MADDDKNKELFKIAFDSQAVERLDKMKEESGAKDRREVLLKALSLYEFCLKEKKAKSLILVQKVGQEFLDEILI